MTPHEVFTRIDQRLSAWEDSARWQARHLRESDAEPYRNQAENYRILRDWIAATDEREPSCGAAALMPTSRRVRRRLTVRVTPETYARLVALRDATGLSLHALLERGAEYIATHPEQVVWPDLEDRVEQEDQC